MYILKKKKNIGGLSEMQGRLSLLNNVLKVIKANAVFNNLSTNLNNANAFNVKKKSYFLSRSKLKAQKLISLVN